MTHNHYHPKNHPGITINKSHGHCRCFLCRDIRMTDQDRDAMLRLIAQDVARKSPVEAEWWLGEWTMRHGDAAAQMLQKHIDKERA